MDWVGPNGKSSPACFIPRSCCSNGTWFLLFPSSEPQGTASLLISSWNGSWHGFHGWRPHWVGNSRAESPPMAQTHRILTIFYLLFSTPTGQLWLNRGLLSPLERALHKVSMANYEWFLFPWWLLRAYSLLLDEGAQSNIISIAFNALRAGKGDGEAEQWLWAPSKGPGVMLSWGSLLQPPKVGHFCSLQWFGGS